MHMHFSLHALQFRSQTISYTYTVLLLHKHHLLLLLSVAIYNFTKLLLSHFIFIFKISLGVALKAVNMELQAHLLADQLNISCVQLLYRLPCRRISEHTLVSF